MGTESAFALNGFSVNGPTWVMAGLANNPQVIDASMQKLAETFNAELGPEDQNKRIVLGQESAGGRAWNTMKSGALPFGVTWTYDGGYMVAASDRATAERAIATRSGGSPLVWSPAFLGQIPSSAGLHPSAFVWLNTKGALGIVLDAGDEPGPDGAAGRARPGSRGLRRSGGTDPRRQPYSSIGCDHGRDAARASEPDRSGAAAPTVRHERPPETPWRRHRS